MERTGSDAAQGLSSSLHQDPDHAKDTDICGGGIFLSLRDLILFTARVDQAAKLSAMVLTSGE